YNRGSCRSCGSDLAPMSVCTLCKEHVSWLCDKCGRAEEAVHVHPAEGFAMNGNIHPPTFGPNAII
ncbi:MAG: hypothetical protein ACREAQ_08575, partial [Nitrososphaera sp.]